MTIHEIKDKIFKRRRGIIMSRGREPTGIVISQEYYVTLQKNVPHEWSSSFIRAEYRLYERGGPHPGDSFMGLDVAVTKAEDTIIVY